MDSVCLTKFGELKPGSHVWDREKMSFKDPDTEDQTLISKSFLEEHNKCYSCALKRHEEYNANCVKAETEVTIFGRNYHRFDFVYVTGRRQERDILKVAQIVDLLFSDGTDNLKVKFFCRYEDDTWAKVDKVNERVSFIPNPYVRLNSQRLFQRALEATDNVARISAERLDGHCHVKPETDIDDLRAWTCRDDHFYIREDGDTDEGFQSCSVCDSAERQHGEIEQLIKSEHRLNALDIFSGEPSSFSS